MEVKDKEDVVVDIVEKVEEPEEGKTTLDEAKEAMGADELAMAQKHGIVETSEEVEKRQNESDMEKNEDGGKKDDKEGDDTEKKEKEEKKPGEEPTDEEIKEFNANEKALYFKTKRFKGRAQSAEKSLQLSSLKLSAKDKQIAELNEKLKAQVDLGYIDENEIPKEDESEKAKTEEDIQKEEALAIQERMFLQSEEAKVSDPHFSQLIDLANETMAEDESGVYAAKFLMIAKDVDGDVPKYIYKMAKLHDKYLETVDAEPQSAKKEKNANKNVNKIVANANKRNSSAVVSSSGGVKTRSVREEDLTPDDALSMTDEQWSKLSKTTRERLCGKPS